MLEEPVWIARERRAEFLREVDLIDVTRGDVLLRAHDCSLKVRTGLIGFKGRRKK